MHQRREYQNQLKSPIRLSYIIPCALFVSLVEIRETQTTSEYEKQNHFRKSISFSISLQVSEDGKSLNVVTFEPQHNHPFSEETYKHLPRQRAINLETLEQVKHDLQIQGNAKLIQRKVERNAEKKCNVKGYFKHQAKNEI